jgi:hypothetical protein
MFFLKRTSVWRLAEHILEGAPNQRPNDPTTRFGHWCFAIDWSFVLGHWLFSPNYSSCSNPILSASLMINVKRSVNGLEKAFDHCLELEGTVKPGQTQSNQFIPNHGKGPRLPAKAQSNYNQPVTDKLG